MKVDDLIGELANNPAARQKLAKMLLADIGDDGEYSSVRLPPDIRTRKRFSELVKGMPGAYKRGQCWIISKAAWDAERAAEFARPVMTPEQIADAALKAAGFRRTK